MPEAAPGAAEQRWNALWYGDAVPSRGLRILAALYGGIVALRRSAYARGWLRSSRTGRALIVVGNLTVGGTGKTPLVIHLAQRLRAAGLTPGILTRGYGRAARGLRLVTRDSTAADVGDEALLLAARGGCEVAVGADRVASAAALVAQGCNVLLSDDGLQHLRLQRDFEIVVIDAQRGFGNGLLLPAGPLREPPARLASVDAVVCNGAGQERAGELALRPDALLVSMHLAGASALAVQDREGAVSRPLREFRARPVHAVAGIGNPQRFFQSLRDAGIAIHEHAFADHHAFTAGDLEFGDDLPVLMTEKDAVKCRAFAGPRHWFVPVEAVLVPEQEQRLLARLIQLAHARGARGGTSAEDRTP